MSTSVAFQGEVHPGNCTCGQKDCQAQWAVVVFLVKQNGERTPAKAVGFKTQAEAEAAVETVTVEIATEIIAASGIDTDLIESITMVDTEDDTYNPKFQTDQFPVLH